MSVPIPSSEGFPLIRTVGLHGLLVTFSDTLTEAANRATLAFRGAVDERALPAVLETSTSLASVFVRFDTSDVGHEQMRGLLQQMLDERDWYSADLPEGRRLWRVPTVYGGGLAPQLAEAADLAGLSETGAVESLSNARVRVLTIGFAPGQPYLGPLGEEWNIPRQSELTPMVPAGALVVAISQLVLFSSATPTGWRHVGQTGIRLFQPDAARPFALNPGDEMEFPSVSEAEFRRLTEADPNFGGAIATELSA